MLYLFTDWPISLSFIHQALRTSVIWDQEYQLKMIPVFSEFVFSSFAIWMLLIALQISRTSKFYSNRECV